ncbi:LytR/AlgR family response regulator transcription factor [Ferruginibacter sp. SUN106]|uniref:LytR/AlgR family response regulator transcription factor n=1 Tax=Ferruginibacter sp. SUN106 TaxID=2978348 RepID=UPI003D36C9A6
MKVVIIEDETPAANRLSKLLLNFSDEVEIIHKADSIESSVRYLSAAQNIDLIFMDIQLADGLSFDIFEKVKITTPVIFTTAFDQYTLKAFKVNSIDYLLKPIDENELYKSLEKYQQLYPKTANNFSDKILKLMQDMNAIKYKERLLIKRGQQLSYLKTESTAYCFADGKLCYAVDFNGTKFLLESNLSQLEEQLQPDNFYRINRHLLVNIEAVKKVHTWLGGRLKLEICPPTTAETIVSRERVNGFKEWLGR